MRMRFVVALMIATAWTARIGLPAAAQEGQEATHHQTHAEQSDEAAVLKLDQAIANAVVRGDTAYVDSVTVADFVMVHGDGWTTGGKPLSTDTKQSMLRRVTTKYYDVIDFDSVKAEMHGDLAITYGRYLAHVPGSPPERSWFAVWYERVYRKLDGRWMYVSHRTVHGPTYGPDRQSVSNK
jgi:hypothetical protein